MTLHRFFINPNNIKDVQILLPEEVSHQISQVLRLKTSDQIIVLDNTGKEYLSTLTKIDKKHSEAIITTTQLNQNEPELKVHLYQSLITRDNFELVLQKSVELGVTQITPIQTERTQFGVNWATEKIERWQKIIKEAAEQSERGKLPTLNPSIHFEPAFKKAIKNGPTIIAWEKEESSSLESELLNHFIARNGELSIFVGPEGGFTEKEIEFAKMDRVKTISLGKRVLRSETATIALLAKLLL